MAAAPQMHEPAAHGAVEQLLTATDGTRLFVCDWPLAPDSQRRGSVLLMHGLGEHGGRQQHVARFFNACGYAARSYDHRGHGRSGGRRGDVPHADALLQDAHIVLNDLARHNLAAGDIMPPLLFGHSMGGLFAARFACARIAPLRGLILSSPALALALSTPQKLLLRLLGALAPGVGISNGLPTAYLSHDPAIEAAYLADPLVHGKVSARLLRTMLDAMAFVHAHASVLALPTLLLVAGDDRLVDASGSRAFFRSLAAGIGTLHVYDDFYHEIFNEREAARVFVDLRAWLTLLAARQPVAASSSASLPA